MTEAVLFPDVELEMCNLLRNVFPSPVTYPSGLLYPSSPLIQAPIDIKIPSTRPPEFIRVMRTGGIRETLNTEAAQVVVEAWAQTNQRASLLLSQARAIINRSEGTLFGARELSGPANLPDPLSVQIRYTMSFQIRAHGAAVNI